MNPSGMKTTVAATTNRMPTQYAMGTTMYRKTGSSYASMASTTGE